MMSAKFTLWRLITSFILLISLLSLSSLFLRNGNLSWAFPLILWDGTSHVLSQTLKRDSDARRISPGTSSGSGADCHVIYLPLLQVGERNLPVRRSMASPSFGNCYPSPSMPDGLPSWGAPIATSPLDERVWVVNPDAGSVTVINNEEKVAEIAVGQEPWSLAISPDGKNVYVVDRAAGVLVAVDAQALVVRATLPIGPEPAAVALSPTGEYAYITITSAQEVAVVDTKLLEVVQRISVGPKPYAVAVTDDGDMLDDDEQVYVTHFFALPRFGGSEATDDGREGRVTVLNTEANAVISEIPLLPDEHGFPNLLASVAIAGNRAWIPQVRAAPDLPVGLTTTVFPVFGSLFPIFGLLFPIFGLLFPISGLLFSV